MPRTRKLIFLPCLGVAILFIASILLAALGILSSSGKELSGLKGFSSQEFWFSLGFESFMLGWAFVVGSSIASFLNVLAYRLPLGLRVTGTSFCPQCKTSISQFDNVPVFGWLMLGGRCRTCHLPIASTYPTNEALGGFIALSIYIATVVGHGFNLPGLRDRSLPFGISIHFDLLEPKYIYIAIIHVFLVLWLFASYLVRAKCSRLPMWVWSIGLITSAIVLSVWPELYIIEFDHATSLGILVRESLSHRKVLLSLILGALAGFLVGWVSRSVGRNQKRAEPAIEPPGIDTSRDWILSWGLIGTVLGWQAVLIISVLVALGTLTPESFRKYGSLWLTTLIFILTWRWLDRSIIQFGGLQQFFAYGLLTIVSVLVFCFESWQNRDRKPVL
jgi:leader peptidase (prepilin peptidase) / N-methyltransferase